VGIGEEGALARYAEGGFAWQFERKIMFRSHDFGLR
jgi:hypothetical protein